MSEILANIWLNIDKFTYIGKQNVSINKHDVDTLKTARKNFLMKPGIILIMTMAFSKLRPKMWAAAKNYLLKGKVRGNIYKTQQGEKSVTNIKSEEIIIEYKRNTNSGYDYDESNKYAINMSRKLSSRRNKEVIGEDITINKSYDVPTYREQYLGYFSKFGSSVKKLKFLKKYADSLTGQEKVLSSGENFLMKTRLIYIPFILILISAIYDLCLNYIGVYLKYQPLIDEYYSQKIKK